MKRVVILLGPPGAGKGTQAVRLAQELRLPHVSTGDLFRENVGQGTDLGRKADRFMKAGKLVPDELVLDMLHDRVGRPDCAGGYLLDGFPRTQAQAEALTVQLEEEDRMQVLNLVVSDEEIVKRITGRLQCRSCGNIQHETYDPPAKPGRCDACGGELYRRKDDEPGVVGKRLAAYRAQTAPLEVYYRDSGILVDIDGERTPDEVFEDLRQALEPNGAEAR